MNPGYDRVTNLLITEQERRGITHTGVVLTPADIIRMASHRLEIFKHKSGHHTIGHGCLPSSYGGG